MKKTLALLLLLGPALLAQERTDTVKEPKEPPKDQISTTQHTVTIGGQSIAYTARAGTIVLKNEDGTPRANFFFVSYTRDGVDPAKRPVTFTFNGGPGSSSVW